MSCDVPFWGRRARQSRPLIPSVKHHGGKSTALKGDMQGRGVFLLDNNYRQLANNDCSLGGGLAGGSRGAVFK